MVRPKAPVVLMYHGFCTSRRADDPENLFVEVDAFEQQLQWLLEHGWTALDLDGYLDARAGGPTPRKSFLVTIDDALVSVADLAAPVLRRLDVPALLFAPSGLLQDTAGWLPAPAHEPILGPEKLRLLQEDFGIEIGSHGCDHRDMRGLDPAELDRQAITASAELGEALGRDVRCMAYPFGLHDEAARDAVRRSGARVAFSVFDDAGRFAVPRVDVNAADTLRTFRIKLMPHYRRIWRLLQIAPWMRRSVRHVATSSARRRP